MIKNSFKGVIFLFMTFSLNQIYSQSCDNYVLYGETKICLPQINNMIECYSNKDVKIWSDQFKGTADEEILGIYLRENDYENFYVSLLSGIDQYIKIYSTKTFENIDFDKELFQLTSNQIIELFSKQYNRIEGKMNERVDEITNGEIKMDKPFFLEEYDLDENIKTIVTLVNFVSQNPDYDNITLITLLNVALIKNKMVFFAYYYSYDDSESIKKAKSENNIFGLKFLYDNF